MSAQNAVTLVARHTLPPVNAEWTMEDKLRARVLLAGCLGFAEAIASVRPDVAPDTVRRHIHEIEEAIGA